MLPRQPLRRSIRGFWVLALGLTLLAAVGAADPARDPAAAPAPDAPGPDSPAPPRWRGELPLLPDFYRSERPKLGVQLVETTPELREHLGGDAASGVLVSKILPGSPAERAGLKVGDLIVAVAGQPVATSQDLVQTLAERDGTTFKIEIVRQRERRTLEVTLPDPARDRPTGPRV